MDRQTSLSLAEQFVRGLRFEGVPKYSQKHLTEPPPVFIPNVGKNQSLVVGAQIQSFTRGVEAPTRQAIMNSALLAQLEAQTAMLSSPGDFKTWYTRYFDALGNIGWLIQQKNFVSFPATGSTVDIHEAVLVLSAKLMGGTETTGYQIVKVTLDAMKSLKDSTPQITIFDRQTRTQTAGSFQVSVAEQGVSGAVRISLMAFRLRATFTERKVIFMPFRQYRATLEHCSGQVGINKSVLDGIAGEIKEKVKDYVEGYVSGIPI